MTRFLLRKKNSWIILSIILILYLYKEIVSIVDEEDGVVITYKDNDKFSVVRFDKDSYYICYSDFDNCSIYYDEACNIVTIVDDVKFNNGGLKND